MPKALLRELTHEEVLHLESHRDLSSHPWPKGVETISPEAKALIDDLHPWPVSNEEAWAIAETHLEATRRKTLRRGFNEEELRDLKRSGIKEEPPQEEPPTTDLMEDEMRLRQTAVDALVHEIEERVGRTLVFTVVEYPVDLAVEGLVEDEIRAEGRSRLSGFLVDVIRWDVAERKGLPFFKTYREALRAIYQGKVVRSE